MAVAFPTGKSKYLGKLDAGASVYPAGNEGESYHIAVEGQLGLHLGDEIRCNTDYTAANTPANWELAFSKDGMGTVAEMLAADILIIRWEVINSGDDNGPWRRDPVNGWEGLATLAAVDLLVNADVVDDTTPTLGGDLDVDVYDISSSSGNDIDIIPFAGQNTNVTRLVADLGGDLDVGTSDIISSSNNDITITPNGSGNTVVTGLQLASDLDVGSSDIISLSNNDITITPNGTGRVRVTGLEAPIILETQTGTTFSAFTLDHAEGMVTMDNASPNTVTLPVNSSIAYPQGTKIHFQQLGAGATTIAITASDTLNVNANLTLVLNGQYAVATAMKMTSTSWTLFGNLVPA